MTNKKLLKILIVGGFGYGDLGDDAILRSIIGSIKRINAEFEFYLFSNNPKETIAYNPYPTYKSIESILRKVFSKKFLINFSFKESKNTFRDFKESFEILRNVDIFLVAGGGFLNEWWGKTHIFRMVEIFLAILMRKKIFLYAQGIGPFSKPLYKLITKFVLDKTDVITVRDKHSKFILAKILEVKKPLVYQTADEAFLLECNWKNKKEGIDILKKSGIKDTDVKIGINIINAKFIYSYLKDGTICSIAISDAELKNIQTKVALALNYLQSKYKAKIVFIPTSLDSDMYAINKVYNLLDRKQEVIILPFGLDPEIIKVIISQLNLLISARMHPIVFAASNSVPSIALTYNPKVDDLMEMLLQENYLFKFNNFNWKDLILVASDVLNSEILVKSFLKRKYLKVKKLAQKNSVIFKDFVSKKYNQN